MWLSIVTGYIQVLASDLDVFAIGCVSTGMQKKQDEGNIRKLPNNIARG